MKNRIINYSGLYGDAQRRWLPDFVHCEPLEARSQLHNWQIESHIHTDLWQIFCLEDGEAKIISAHHTWQTQGMTLVIIPPNTLHGFEFVAGLSGIVLTVSSSYWDRLLQTAPTISLAFQEMTCLVLDKIPDNFQKIKKLIEKIREEENSTYLEKNFSIQATLGMICIEIFRLASAQNDQKLVSNQRSLSIYRNFVKSIKESYSPQKSITQYAEEQKITIVHLNRVCRNVTDKSAIQCVHDFFVEEAKKYLLYTNLSIAEVAYQVNFDDPAYFSRLFKKVVGLSPKDFKEKSRNLYF